MYVEKNVHETKINQFSIQGESKNLDNNGKN